MENLKKIIFVIIINLILLFFILLTLEFFCLVMRVNDSCNRMLKNNNLTFIVKNAKALSLSYFQTFNFLFKKCYLDANKEEYIFSDAFRSAAIGSQYKNESIVLAGCSFTYGDGLDDINTFSTQLAKYLPKYKVYNIGLCGSSAKEILYILRNYETFSKNDILPSDRLNTKYFIYTYIYDHERRLKINVNDTQSPDFKVIKDKNGIEHLEYIKPHFDIMKISFLVKYIKDKTYHESCTDLQILYVKEIKREVEKIFPNAKFVMFVYEKPEFISQGIMQINELGIYVVNINDLSDINFFTPQYQLSDNFHPNANAWNTIIPLLSKKISLK